MFYNAGIFRFQNKEFKSAWYNFQQAKKKSLNVEEINEKLSQLGKILDRKFISGKNLKSIKSSKNYYLKKNLQKKKENSAQTPDNLSFLNSHLYYFYGLIIIIFFLFHRKNKDKWIRKISEESKNTPKEKLKEKNTYQEDNREKILEMLKDRKTEEKELDYTELEEEYYEDDEPYLSKPKTERIIIPPSEKLNQNIGEINLAMNLQRKKRDNIDLPKKYSEINKLRQRNFTVEEIAKRLNITLTEVELYIQMKN
jgi:hypothetical protein